MSRYRPSMPPVVPYTGPLEPDEPDEPNSTAARVDSFLNSINVYPNIRPENLTLEEFCKLEFALRKN